MWGRVHKSLMAKVDFLQEFLILRFLNIFPVELSKYFVLKVIDFGRQDILRSPVQWQAKEVAKEILEAEQGNRKQGNLSGTGVWTARTVLQMQLAFLQFLQCFRSMLHEQVCRLLLYCSFFPELYCFHLFLHGPKSWGSCLLNTGCDGGYGKLSEPNNIRGNLRKIAFPSDFSMKRTKDVQNRRFRALWCQWWLLAARGMVELGDAVVMKRPSFHKTCLAQASWHGACRKGNCCKWEIYLTFCLGPEGCGGSHGDQMYLL